MAEPDSLINTVVAGRYEVYAKLGEGGMGAVYAARQTPLGRTVALKVLLKQLSEDPIAVKRFEKEAVAISRLAHPNTVTIFDFGTTEQGLMYIAMEFLEGRSLREVIDQEAPLRPRRVVRILAQMVRALSEAHQRGVIHRDLKPDNIMLVPTAGEPDFVKVLDFGVAKLRSQGGVDVKTLTKGDVIFGTPSYMSPEQVHGIMDDLRSDLYAVGAIAYEMLCGQAPFRGASAMDILIAQVQQAPVAFASLQRPVEVPVDLEALVMKLLSKQREDRFQDCDDLLHGLDRLPGIGGGLRPPSGDTIGMQRPALTPESMPKLSTQMMGSHFAKPGAGGEQGTQPNDAPEAQSATQTIASIATPEAKSSDASSTEASPEPKTEAQDLNETLASEPPPFAAAPSSPSPEILAPAAAAPKRDNSALVDDEVLHPAGASQRLLLSGLLGFALLILIALVWFLSTQKKPQPMAKAGFYKLILSCQPQGAQIFLDGKKEGTCPVTLPLKATKSYALRAEQAGYQSSAQQIELENDQDMTLILVPNKPAVDAAADIAAKDIAAADIAEADSGSPDKAPLPAVMPQRTPQQGQAKQGQARPKKPARPAEQTKKPQADDDKAVKDPASTQTPPSDKPSQAAPKPQPVNPGDFEKFDDFKAVD